jgi:RNA polymerase sigma-70 factor, ECF subfamily
MIKGPALGHEGAMAQSRLALGDRSVGAVDGARMEAGSPEKRLRELVDAHHDFVWRSLRRLGVPDGDVDDATQKVYSTLARKLDSVRAGAERSYLFQTALRVAADCRRTLRRRREVGGHDEDDQRPDDAPSAEDLVDLQRARKHLDRILDAMSLELRAVFVLFELDEMTMAQIAELLDVPPGTVASRLRRARAEFRREADALRPRKLAGGAR